MSKSEGQKMKLFALKEILEAETDANHGITMPRIIELLSMRGIKAERKSLYDDIRVFRDTGYLDVTIPQGQHREYSVASRTFELSELKMMIDIIYASSFVSEKKAASLISRLKQFCSIYQSNELNRQLLTVNVKSKNEQTMYNVDTIYRAIAADRQISFKYAEYGVDQPSKHLPLGVFRGAFLGYGKGGFVVPLQILHCLTI